MARPAKYPEQFRRDAVELVESSGRPIAEVARSLPVSEGTLWNWVRDARAKKTRDTTLMGCRSPNATSSSGCARR